MNKLGGNSEEKTDILNVSNDDFESPIVFKKFKPPNISSNTKKQKKPSRKKQLTLHQVYNKNFSYSDMNSEHLQLALALSRSTSEVLSDHNSKEDFPLISQKDTKKKTLLEFGFRIDKPKMNVENKILNRDTLKINKKSKFRFVTPILMMRTEEDRESIIQSKLSSIFGQNSIHPICNRNIFPEVWSTELELIRCQRCSLFNLNNKDDSFVVPQLNMEGSRAKCGVLLKNWKQIALRDPSPSPSRMEITNVNQETQILDSKSEIKAVGLEQPIEDYLGINQSSGEDSDIITNKNELTVESKKSGENLQSIKSPACSRLSACYEYGSISPDLFDNDSSLLKEHTQKKNLNKIFSQQQLKHDDHTVSLTSINQSSGEKMLVEKCELTGKEMSNECETNNHYLLSDMVTVEALHSKNGIECDIEDIDKSLFNVNGIEKKKTLSNKKDEFDKVSKSYTSLVSDEDTIILTSDDEDFPSKQILKVNKCQKKSSITSNNSLSDFRSSDEQGYQPPKNNFSETCIDSHSNEDMADTFSASAGDHITAKSFKSIEYDLSYDCESPTKKSSVSYNDEILFTSKIDVMNEINRESFNEIILSSDDEYFNDENNENSSDRLEIEKLHVKYSNNSNNDSFESLDRKNVPNFAATQNCCSKRVGDSFNCLDFTDINDLNNASENFGKKKLRIPNNSFENHMIVNDPNLVSSNQTCDTEISEKLILEKSIEKYSDCCYISKVEQSSEIPLTERYINCRSYKESSDFLNGKHFSNDSTNFSPKITTGECKETTNGRNHLPHVSTESHDRFSDILTDSVLGGVFEKSSCSMKNISYGSEGLEIQNNVETETQESQYSFESDNEIKFFSDNKLMYKPNQCDIQEVTSENKIVQYVKKTSSTPFRRCTSFNMNGTLTKSISFTRHKSESNITPDRKLILKTENITPMLNYNNLSTPDIVKELDKFGLKPLKRKRGINLLKHIYETTHPILDSHLSDAGEKSIVKRRKSHNDMDSELIKSQWKTKTINVWAGSILESEAIFERQRSSKIPTCQVPLQIVWHNFLSENPDILQNILLYEPLQVEVIHKTLKELGYKFHIQDLITFLDQRCITIRVAQGNQGKIG